VEDAEKKTRTAATSPAKHNPSTSEIEEKEPKRKKTGQYLIGWIHGLNSGLKMDTKKKIGSRKGKPISSPTSQLETKK